MAKDEEPGRRSWDVVPLLVLAAVLLLGLAAWWLFPLAQHAISVQDCVAAGRVNC